MATPFLGVDNGGESFSPILDALTLPVFSSHTGIPDRKRDELTQNLSLWISRSCRSDYDEQLERDIDFYNKVNIFSKLAVYSLDWHFCLNESVGWESLGSNPPYLELLDGRRRDQLTVNFARSRNEKEPLDQRGLLSFYQFAFQPRYARIVYSLGQDGQTFPDPIIEGFSHTGGSGVLKFGRSEERAYFEVDLGRSEDS